MSELPMVRLDVRTSNPLNGSQGRTRGAMLARAAERKRVRFMAAILSRAAIGPHPWVSLGGRAATIRLTRIAPRPLDDDGWQAAAKPVRDGVADYLGIADNDARVTWSYGQRRGRVREHAVEIEIERRIG